MDVRKRAVGGTGVSWETLTQEPRLRLASRSNIQIFFIEWDSTLERLKASSRPTQAHELGNVGTNRFYKLGLRKNQGIEAVILEESISDTDLGKGGTQQVLTMPRVGFIVDPPVDRALTVQRRIIAVDIFSDRPGSIAGICHTGSCCRAIAACMDVKLVAGDINRVSLCCLG